MQRVTQNFSKMALFNICYRKLVECEVKIGLRTYIPEQNLCMPYSSAIRISWRMWTLSGIIIKIGE